MLCYYIYIQATVSDFHSVLWCNWYYRCQCHSKLLKQYQWINVPMFQCQMSNVNKVNFLSERTSGVPPVIFNMVTGRVDVYILQSGWKFVQIQSTLRLVYISWIWTVGHIVPILVGACVCMFQFGLRISELKGCKTSDTDCPLIGVSLPPTCFTKCKSE